MESQTIHNGDVVVLNHGDTALYNRVKRSAGWAEVPMSKLVVRGADRLDLLQRLTTNDIRTLQPGEGNQTVLLTDKARIIDVLTIVARHEDIVVLFSEGMEERVVAWLDKYTIMDDFRVESATQSMGALLLTGPDAPHVLAELTGEPVATLPQFHWKQCSLFGAEVMLVRSLTLCEFSYIALFPEEQREQVVGGFRACGEAVPHMSDDVVEVLHVEAAQGRVGREWTEEHNPLEAGLVRIVSFKKGCYIGQEVVARLDSYNKVKQHLVGFTAATAVPVGAEFRDSERATGRVTRSVFSPELQKHIGLGYIRTLYANPGTVVTAHNNGEEYQVELVKLPFTM